MPVRVASCALRAASCLSRPQLATRRPAAAFATSSPVLHQSHAPALLIEQGEHVSRLRLIASFLVLQLPKTDSHKRPSSCIHE